MDNYQGLILDDICLHGTPARNPKPMLMEMLHAAKRGIPVRVYSNATKLFTTRHGSQQSATRPGMQPYRAPLAPPPVVLKNGESTRYTGVLTSYQAEPYELPDGKIGLSIAFSGNKAIADQWQAALKEGIPFKLYVDKAGIRVYMDENLKQRIRAYNKKTKTNRFTTDDWLADLYSFDIIDTRTGAGIIRIVLR